MRVPILDRGDPQRARLLSERLDAPWCQTVPDGLHLVVGPDALELDDGGPGAPVRVDLVAAAARRGGGAPLLARALAVGGAPRLVVDATAGLGRDAATLAARGAEVILLERHPVLVAMLEDGLARARRDAPELAARMSLVETEATAWLRTRATSAERRPDAVLIDPMYPSRGKRALPRRDMQLFRLLLAVDDPDVSAELVAAARAVALRRVVVKRPVHAAPLVPQPTATHAGARVRFDIYAPAT